MYDDILLPVAPDSDADRAIPHAAGLANSYDATVHVVSAVDTVQETLRGPRVGTLAERVESAAEERVGAVAERLTAEGVTVERAVVRGPPHEVIVDAVEASDADLVVMPSHTRTGLERFLLGSVTERVVRLSPVPVMSVPMRSE